MIKDDIRDAHLFHLIRHNCDRPQGSLQRTLWKAYETKYTSGTRSYPELELLSFPKFVWVDWLDEQENATTNSRVIAIRFVL